MYIPAGFAETDLTKLHEFIEQNSFGLLVSQVDGRPFATHLPFLLERTAGPHGTLVGHVARANPQWREAAGQTALAIFPGPHAHVSPTRSRPSRSSPPGTTPPSTPTGESRPSKTRVPS